MSFQTWSIGQSEYVGMDLVCTLGCGPLSSQRCARACSCGGQTPDHLDRIIEPDRVNL